MTRRPETAPNFLLSRPTGSIRTQGWTTVYRDPFDAATALSDSRAGLIVGAIPFDTSDDAALTEPIHVVRSEGPLEPPAYFRGGADRLQPTAVRVAPSREEHQAAVAAAVATIAHTHMEKVVLARHVDVDFGSAPDPLLIAARLIDLSANRDGFYVDIPADDQRDGEDSDEGEASTGAVGCANRTSFAGSSPELLIARRGQSVEAFPLAGSKPRSGSRAVDEVTAQGLLDSAKDLGEHRLVVEHYRQVLEPICAELHIPERPEIHETSEMIHLGTPIRGRLRDCDFSALDLALMLHPTPAVGGTPTETALGVIAEYEPSRRFYAGAVGWCDSDGDGEYMVAIRSCEISGTTVRAWAGGGIVASSEPAAEVEETSAKMQTVLRALGVPAGLRECV